MIYFKHDKIMVMNIILSFFVYCDICNVGAIAELIPESFRSYIHVFVLWVLKQLLQVWCLVAKHIERDVLFYKSRRCYLWYLFTELFSIYFKQVSK